MKEDPALLQGAHDAGPRGLAGSTPEPPFQREFEFIQVPAFRDTRRAQQGVPPQVFTPELKLPLMQVDLAGVIQHANDAARRLLHASDILCDRGGLLSCSSPEGHRALREAMRDLHARKDGERWPRPPVRAVRLYRRDGTHLHLFMCSVKNASTWSAMVLVHESRRDDDESETDLVSNVFDLTPAEARVALKLANGWTVKDIARASRTSVPTVRSQLQHTLHKVGVSRQVDLVRLLLALPFCH